MKKIKLLLLGILLALLPSCYTKKQCAGLFPPSIIIKDSIVYKEKISYRDTIVYVRIPGDTITDTIPVFIYKGLVNSKLLKVDGKFAFATAQVVNSKLGLVLIEKDTTLEFKLKDAIKQIEIWKEKYNSKEVTRTITVNKSPWYTRILAWLGGVILIMVGTWVILKFKLWRL